MKSKKNKFTVHIEEFTKRMRTQMIRGKEKNRVYEQKLDTGTHTNNPKVSTQFN